MKRGDTVNFSSLNPFRSNERRGYPRMPVSFDVMYGHGEELTLTTAIDMSEGGLSFFSNTNLPEGTELDMRLIVNPENQEDTIELTTQVVRSENHLTAVTFKGISRSSLHRIQSYMEHMPAFAEVANL